MTRLTLTIIGAAMLCGCVGVQLPTADDVDDLAGHPAPPMRANAQTCGAELWIREDAWTPIQDSATCPDGFPAEQVGYALSPIEGSCQKAAYTLNGYRAIYGCIKRQVITREERVRDSLWWEGSDD